MAYSTTRTLTWTITQARYVASKIAADLELMRSYYSKPAAEHITNLAEEAAILLAGGYLNTIEYGFRVDGKTMFALRYTARADGSLADDRAGRVPSHLNTGEAEFYSYLTGTSAYHSLTEAQREKLELPIKRTTSDEPKPGQGHWEYSRTYSSNGQGVERKVFKPY